jgi:hypothetical protein
MMFLEDSVAVAPAFEVFWLELAKPGITPA